MSLDRLILKIPKSILVGGVLILALIFFVFNDPLRDECEVQISLFEKRTRGILTAVQRKGKIQFAQMTYWKDFCRAGNSPGACEDYLNGLRLIVTELKSLSEQCQTKYSQQNEDFFPHITSALQILPLLAWGEKPPEGLQARMGWLNESHIKTFCALKNTYILTAGDEAYLQLREQVYLQFPDQWSDKTPIDGRTPENRPLAYKTASRPEGSLTKEQVYERSLFSIRCDLYM